MDLNHVTWWWWRPSVSVSLVAVSSVVTWTLKSERFIDWTIMSRLMCFVFDYGFFCVYFARNLFMY